MYKCNNKVITMGVYGGRKEGGGRSGLGLSVPVGIRLVDLLICQLLGFIKRFVGTSALLSPQKS
eukprot:6043178-Amphidinium_carterae.1